MKDNRKRTDDFIDDGRVIADMNVDGMPQSIFRRFSLNNFGTRKEKSDTMKLSKKERRSIFLAVAASYLVFGVVVFGVYGLFILFCTNVWFK
ncbi:MAG TPA: hypothetical protein PK830_08610 [Candidatus Atribacteria bacterium]|nr:hypothetical protein [Candidatus Atribacteria bacterium]HPT79146.1 hypothetical protein [Candidatus Atribacteria bacterium]